uniref:Bifunctional inhibitor/plant lipid transfer protein/seed storage helical domain-containing protein n=1 Tax=Setaria digitata TaxID=48799 RepID=A0A915PPP4_9BILA
MCVNACKLTLHADLCGRLKCLKLYTQLHPHIVGITLQAVAECCGVR